MNLTILLYNLDTILTQSQHTLHNLLYNNVLHSYLYSMRSLTTEQFFP